MTNQSFFLHSFDTDCCNNIMAKGESRDNRRHGESRGNKRRFNGKGCPHADPARTPRRGPPAIFVSCEAGRERKCQREAMELIHHYYYASRPSMMQNQAQYDDEKKYLAKDVASYVHEDQSLSLEEELAMLRKGAAAEEVLSYEPNLKRPRTFSTNATPEQISSMKSPFSVYDTGMRGMICILCTLPGCEMVPYDEMLSNIRGAKEKSGSADASGNGNKGKSNGNPTTVNRDSVLSDSPKDHGSEDHAPPLWDPVETVKCIFRDAKSASKGGNATNVDSTKDEGIIIGQGVGGEKKPSVPSELSESPPPGSRFITRMIPMQTTVSTVAHLFCSF
jgi:hypothetical protein